MKLQLQALIVLALGLSPSAVLAAEAVQGEFLLKMKGRPSSAQSAKMMGKLSGKANLKATFGKLNMHHMSLKAGQSFEELYSELSQDPDVEYVERNYILRKVDGTADSASMSFDDAVTSLSDQNRSLGSYAQSGAPTKTTQAWGQISQSSSEIPIVAVIDTGVDYTHSGFPSGTIWQNPGEIDGNGIDDDGNGYIDDIRGWNFVHKSNDPMDDDDHGTHVAGIIVGVSRDIFSETDTSPAMIQIMPLKFLSADGSGATSDAIQAIYYAVNNGARIINNSWGGDNYSQALHDALAYAYQHHVAIAAAAGNFASNNDKVPLFPANYPIPSQLSVAASNDLDTLASFSNYGAVTVHVSAPGVSILSTTPGDRFRYMSGTSMAAPFVAGMMALAAREAPQLTGYQIRNLVMNTGEYIQTHSSKTITGFRVNTLNSVLNSKTQISTQPDQPEYVASAFNTPMGDRAPASAQAAPKVGGCGTVGTVALYDLYTRPGSGPKGPQAVLVLALLPLLVWFVLRARQAAEAPSNRRAHPRFVMNSEIKVKMGERELVGNLSTISMGGVSFEAEAMLEKGGVVTLQIAGPDGSEQIQVEGRIVWNEANRSYGVQFQDAKTGVLERISNWTANLSKAS